jgi:hypothetical protein
MNCYSHPKDERGLANPTRDHCHRVSPHEFASGAPRLRRYLQGDGSEREAANYIGDLVSQKNGRFIAPWEADHLKAFFYAWSGIRTAPAVSRRWSAT